MIVIRAVLVSMCVAAIAVGVALLRDPVPPHAGPADGGGNTDIPPGGDLSGLEPIGQALEWIDGVETYRAEMQLAAQQTAEDEAARIAQLQAQEAQLVGQGEKLAAVEAAVAVTPGEHAATMACIRAHESDTAGGYSADNPGPSTASGAYQILDTTWDGYAGYSRAIYAPPEVQDAWAREALATVGTRPWAGSGC